MEDGDTRGLLRLPTVIGGRGLHLLGTTLWFDAAGRHDLCFVSGVTARASYAHRKVLCTEETARLVRARGGRPRALTAPYEHPIRMGPLRLELIPSGHVLGGAQLRVTYEGARILYTGTVATEALPTSPPLESREADLVIAHAHCVPPDHPLGSTADAARELLEFVAAALAEDVTPVLLTEPIGTGQDVLKLLGEAGHAVAAHRTLYRLALDYRACGVRFPLLRPFRGRVEPGHVLVWPRRGHATAALARLPRKRIALLGYETAPPATGPEAAPLDAVLPYGNLSTAVSLLAWLREIEPRRVIFHGPYDRVLADRLARETRIETLALSQAGQLPLFPAGRRAD